MKLVRNHDMTISVITQEIKIRKELGLTQTELAEIMGTKQENISRFESGTYNPTLKFLWKMAKALGKNLKVTLE